MNKSIFILVATKFQIILLETQRGITQKCFLIIRSSFKQRFFQERLNNLPLTGTIQ